MAHRLVFSKRYIGSTKNCGRSLILWHWKAHRKFGVKLTPGFQFSPGKILPIWLNRARRVKISNFIGWFWLKDKLLEQKIDIAVSCSDTEGPWKVWGKTDSWFPIQPRKNCANLIVFCPSNLSFRQKKPIKCEILTFLSTQRKFTLFFVGGGLNWNPLFRLCWNF